MPTASANFLSPIGIGLAALNLLLLVGCSSAPTFTPVGNPPVQLQRLSAPQAITRPTIGTAKDIFAKAEELALRWSPQAEPVSLEGRFISANGLNDTPIDASWTIAFVSPNRPGKAFRVFSRSEHLQMGSQEISAGSLAGLEPLAVRAWTYDSSAVLKKARSYSEFVAYPVSPLELQMQDQRLVWKIPQMSPMPPLMIDAMQGQQVQPRR
ncbi:MAG: hypothetical protein AB7I41_14090 [Candidatus Sericytochromatia bacterium]